MLSNTDEMICCCPSLGPFGVICSSGAVNEGPRLRYAQVKQDMHPVGTNFLIRVCEVRPGEESAAQFGILGSVAIFGEHSSAVHCTSMKNIFQKCRRM